MTQVDEHARMRRREIGLRRLAGESERSLAAFYGRGRAFIRSCADEFRTDPQVEHFWDEDMKEACRFAARHYGHYAATEIVVRFAGEAWSAYPREGAPVANRRPHRHLIGRVTYPATLLVGRIPDIREARPIVLDVAQEKLDTRFLHARASQRLCEGMHLPHGWMRIDIKSGRWDWREPGDMAADPPWLDMERDHVLRRDMVALLQRDSNSEDSNSEARFRAESDRRLIQENAELRVRLDSLEKGLILPRPLPRI